VRHLCVPFTDERVECVECRVSRERLHGGSMA